MLLKISILLYTFFALDPFGFIENKITINLHRRKSAYDKALETNNLEGFLDLMETYGKNKTNHTISLTRFLDNEFYGKVQIGSRNKEFNVLFDSAWTRSWVISKNCPSTKVGCMFHAKYDHSTSATANATNEKFLINEGAYNISGTITYDNFNIAGLKIINQKFAEITDIPYSYVFTKADGVIGLGLPYNGEETFFQYLLKKGEIKTGIFALYMNRDRSSNRGGDISLGFVPTKHIHVTNHQFDAFTYVPVDPTNGRWEFTMDGVFVEKKKTLTPGCTKDCVAFIDSTSNFIIVPKQGFDSLNSIIESRPLAFGRYEVDCDKVNILPKLHFVINGRNFTLSGKEYIQKVSLSSFQLCISALRPTESPSETGWILGGAFLSHFYSTYDVDNSRIGFVRAA